MRLLLAVAALVMVGSAAAYADPVDPAVEPQNYAKIYEREQHIVLTPEFQTLLAAQSAAGSADLAARLARDPERTPANVCGARAFECAGDVRFYDWQSAGRGIKTPVVFTARSGATLSGTVWATRSGPAQRPLVVITTGSVQAPETLYWRQAATLAKHGYVVLTYDVQGQGLSDTLGEGDDRDESVPAQAGEPFYDGTEDALDFALSDPGAPYEPRPSCTTGISHAAKQDRRVAAGLDTAYNPLHDLVDPTRVGIAGHSLGAAAVSFVGQGDPRVDALVAWDNLGTPTVAPTSAPVAAPACASAPTIRVPSPITRPAMGISNDYGITPTPNTQVPDPQGKTAAYSAYRARGVDTAEIVIRGGCHEESAFIPGSATSPVSPLACGTLRGNDLIAWYTTAWFDIYVKGDPGAETRLLTDRWRNDRLSQAVDQRHDPNMFSFYYRSRLNVTRADGTRAVCDDLRTGCPVLAADGLPPDYGVTTDALTLDGTASLSASSSGVSGPCATTRTGTARADRLRGTSTGDRLVGRGGPDRLRGRRGSDCLRGGSGADRLDGGLAVDRIRAGAGDDVIRSTDASRDRVRCGPGADRVVADRRDQVARSCEVVVRRR